MAVLAGIFSNGQEQTHDSDKLMHLFWNRTELKKEFARLRNEKYRLSDKIKQQEGETAKALQNLEHLEQMLADPGTALNVLVHYQVRGLGQRCASLLTGYAEELKQQCERKQRNMVLMAWNDERTRQQKLVDRKLQQVHESVQQVNGRIRLEQAHVNSMGFFRKLFRRRRVNVKLDFLQGKLERIRNDESELQGKLESIKNQRPPENSGLDVTNKRLINLKIIAFAQQLYLLLNGAEFAATIKQTMDCSVGGVNYGDKATCDQLLKSVSRYAALLERNFDFSAVVDKRAEVLGNIAKFCNSTDVVPVPTSVATVISFAKDGEVEQSDGNLLGENYWGVAKVLCR